MGYLFLTRTQMWVSKMGSPQKYTPTGWCPFGLPLKLQPRTKATRRRRNPQARQAMDCRFPGSGAAAKAAREQDGLAGSEERRWFKGATHQELVGFLKFPFQGVWPGEKTGCRV